MTTTLFTNCPSCGDPIDVIQYADDSYVILANGKPVNICPVCGARLSFENGKLVAEKKESHV
jgi:hypothetical protein